MTKPACRARYLLSLAVMLAAGAIPCAVLANTGGPYLNWRNKTPATTQTAPETPPPETPQVRTPTGDYPVPPSPYGQVGDPYARSLRWPAKQTPAVASVPSSPTAFAPMPAPPVRAPSPVSVSQPVPVSAPQPVAVTPLPSERPDPGLADDPGMADDAPIAAAPPKAALKTEPLPTAPLPAAPAPAAVASALTTDGAYEVPATSKYAARIAAARAAALPVAEAAKNDQASTEKPTATAPEPDISLASQEADHIFIPGEHYKTPADEPRLYSLHRQYGMKPDPISVTPNATGALLTLTPEAVEDGDTDSDRTPAAD